MLLLFIRALIDVIGPNRNIPSIQDRRFLYQKLIPYRYSSFSCCWCWGDALQNKPKAPYRFKSDRDNIR